MTDEELSPVPAYVSDLEEGEIREFKCIAKTIPSMPLPESPSESPVIPLTSVPEPIPEPIPEEDITIEPTSFCGCGRRRKQATNSLFHYLYALF